MDNSTTAIILFIAAYVLFVFLPRWRSWVAVAAALLLVVTRTMTLTETLHAVNWNVMGIFVGMLIAADVFIESRFPAYFAEIIVNRAKNTAWAILYICILTSAISAIAENVATVLIVAPIALSISKKLKINPVSILIAIAIASNLQGAATLIGDPPSMLLAGYSKMQFLDFFVYHGKPSIFWAVEFGALTSFIVLYLVFRKHKEASLPAQVEEVRSWTPTILIGLLILALSSCSYFDKDFRWLAGTLCMVCGIGMLLWESRNDRALIVNVFKRMDWHTTFFLLGIFIIVESLTLTGWIDTMSASLSNLIHGNALLGYTILIAGAVAASGVVDNVPFLATMLPVAQSMATTLGIDPAVFMFGLLIGASLGGNITPVGASANIVACGLLRKEGYHVGFGEFAKISVPFTLAAVIPASILVWFIWGP